MAIHARDKIGAITPSGRVVPKEGSGVVSQSRRDKIREMAENLLREAEQLTDPLALEAESPVTGVNFFDEVRRFEMRLVRRALELAGGSEARAARLLGLTVSTLNRKIKSYNFKEEPRRQSRSLRNFGFAGIWTDRGDIKDGVSYVNSLRNRPRA